MTAERAGYTVTMFVVDVSASMAKTRVIDLPPGPQDEKRQREITNLQWGIQYVKLKIQEMIFNGRKTDQCGVVLMGTDDTSNEIASKQGGYSHVTEFIPVATPSSRTLKKLSTLTPSESTGDPVDAIIVAVEAQDRYLATKKSWTRKVVLVTDGENTMEDGDIPGIASKLNELNVNMIIVGIDFDDDDDYPFKEEDKNEIKASNEEVYHEFVKQLDKGVVGTCAYALQEVAIPDIRNVRSILSGYVLRMGDFDSRPKQAIELHVKTSKCTALLRPPTMKKFAIEVPKDPQEADEKDHLTYRQLRIHSEYVVDREEDGQGTDNDDTQTQTQPQTQSQFQSQSLHRTQTATQPSTQPNVSDEQFSSGIKVEKEQLVRGYKYGSTYVPCEEDQFKRLGTLKGIDVLGFFPLKSLRRDFAMSEVQYVWAEPTSASEQVALSSIVQAMVAKGVIAIAKWVTRDEMDPRMGLLIPRQFDNVDCFLWLQMPFADDVRKITFPSLEHLQTKKGEVVEHHALLPTAKMTSAMEAFVGAMDLQAAETTADEGDSIAWFDVRESYNPAVHRIKQALFHAAIVADLNEDPVPPPHPELLKYFKPPKKLVKRAQEATQDCIEAFNVQEVVKAAPLKRKESHVKGRDSEILPTGFAAQEPEGKVPTEKAKLRSSEPDDSETDPGSDEEQAAVKGKVNAKAAVFDPQREPGRIIGSTDPLSDFVENLKQGDLVTKAVEDLEYVLKSITLQPFANRRHQELLKCMHKMRHAALQEDEIDRWNGFLLDFKKSCLAKSSPNNREFWKLLVKEKSLGLISADEAESVGGESNISVQEAGDFLVTE